MKTKAFKAIKPNTHGLRLDEVVDNNAHVLMAAIHAIKGLRRSVFLLVLWVIIFTGLILAHSFGVL